MTGRYIGYSPGKQYNAAFCHCETIPQDGRGNPLSFFVGVRTRSPSLGRLTSRPKDGVCMVFPARHLRRKGRSIHESPLRLPCFFSVGAICDRPFSRDMRRLMRANKVRPYGVFLRFSFYSSLICTDFTGSAHEPTERRMKARFTGGGFFADKGRTDCHVDRSLRDLLLAMTGEEHEFCADRTQ